MSFPPGTEMFQFPGFAPHVQTGFHVPRLTQGYIKTLRLRGYHPLWPAFPDRSASSMNNHLVVPVEYITKWETTPIVNKKYQSSTLEENELYVEKNLLDKQIIDIKGNKVVRVNDIAIQNKPVLYVAGVDIGILGILRWLSLEEPIRKALRYVGLRISLKLLS